MIKLLSKLMSTHPMTFITARGSMTSMWAYCLDNMQDKTMWAAEVMAQHLKRI